MALKERINDDLKAVLKAGKAFEAGVLRLINASLKNREIEKRGKGDANELSEEEVIEIIAREAKKRKESIKLYSEGGREELAKTEQDELAVIEQYLPKQMPREEVETKVKEIVKQLGATNKKEFGKVMGSVMKELKGKTDASVVSEILKGLLQD